MFKLAEHKWKQDVESKPKLRLYKTFKTNLKPANHLQSYIPRYKRSLLSQFRAGVLPLRIETVIYHLIKDSQTKKYRKLNTEERTCLTCNTESVEDEIHFLCKCCIFKEPREKCSMRYVLR